MSRKGVVSWILALVLVISFAATGWAGGAGEPAQVPTLSMMTTDIDYAMKDNSPVQQYMEQKYGVKIKIVRVASEQRQSLLAALIAADGLPDVFFLGGGGYATVSEMYRQNAIAPIDMDAFKKYAPKTYAGIVKAGKDYSYDPWMTVSADGKVYGVPSPSMSGLASNNVYLRGWHLELLKDLGINAVPQTISDMEEIGKRQVAKDPSVYMINAYGKVWLPAIGDIYGAFGYNLDNWVYAGGKIQYASIMPETKQATALLADWYKKGYLDPEWITDGWDESYKKWIAGKTMSFIWTHVTALYPDNPKSNNDYQQAKAVNPKAELVPSPWVKGPTGKCGWQTYTMASVFSARVFSKKMAADPMKVRKYFEMLEGYNYDDETQLTASYGVKGTDWNVDANGLLTFTALSEEKINTVGTTRLWSFLFSVDRGLEGISRKYMNPDQKAMWAWADKFIAQYPDVFNLKNRYASYDITTKPADLDKKATAAKAIIDTAITGIILNTKPLSAFDDAVKQWLDAGGREVTDFINANNKQFLPK